MEEAKNFLFNGLYSLIDGGFGGGLFSDINKTLSFSNQVFSGQLWNTISTVYNNLILPFSVGLMVLWFLVALMEKASDQNFSFEVLVKMLIKYIFAYFLMKNGLNIIEVFLGIGGSLVNKFGTIADSNITLANDLKALVEQDANGSAISGIFSALSWYIQLLIPCVLGWIMKIMVNVMAYGRLIELAIKAMFAPIPLADMFSDGGNSTGIRYLKSFLATCLQGVVIAAIAFAYSTMVSGFYGGAATLTNLFPTLGLFLIGGLSAMLLISKSQQLAKEIVGV